MVIKKFQGSTEREAVLQAKEELGNDAVVVNVKTIKQRGVMKLFKPTMVEITVAQDENQNKEPVEKNDFSSSAKAIDITINDEMENEDEKNPANDTFLSEAEKAAEIIAQFMPKEAENINKSNTSELEKKLENIQNLIEKQIEVKEEKEEIKENVNTEKSEAEIFTQLLYNTLIDNEVDEKYINAFLGEIEKSPSKDLTIDQVLANIYQRMILKLGEASTIEMPTKKPKVVFLIGPTGVGKTTTLAKIASRFHVDGDKKIAMLTADTYRIAATEQLKTYANILGVPFSVVYSEEELLEKIEKYKNFDFILVDTAGHSHKNLEQKQDVKKLLECVDGVAQKDVYLVVSAATKYKDLIKIIDSYNDMTDYKIIFTKLDETTSLGNILNIKMYSQKDLAYVTLGQNVPDDIEIFDAQSLVKQLLGGQ